MPHLSPNSRIRLARYQGCTSKEYLHLRRLHRLVLKKKGGLFLKVCVCWWKFQTLAANSEAVSDTEASRHCLW